jgi:SAM-dependent methyltransferase
MEGEGPVCPVCRGAVSLLDVVDFNKTCEEFRGRYFDLAGVPVYYALCGSCGFCFAPELCAWPPEEFAARIYNDEYVVVDPDCVETRPRANAASLVRMFRNLPASIRHLDYGGGNGLLAKVLREAGWDSVSYDPLADKDVKAEHLGKFDLITAFEVFEHVPDVQGLMSDLRLLLSPGGVVLFSTLLSDGDIQPNRRLTWWYASPRNGHISLFSKRSLALLAKNSGWNFGSFSRGSHAFFTSVPSWAAHLIRINPPSSTRHESTGETERPDAAIPAT